MERIRTFLDNMFLSLPDTPEVREAKAHILEGMLDRYEALLAQGKSEDEAFGVVIGEFGSVEELRQELGLSAETAPEPLPFPPAPVPADFPWEEYSAFQKRYPIGIAAGVIICITAVAIWGVLSEVEGARDARFHHMMFLLMIAAAVGLFVYFGIKEGQYKDLLRQAGGVSQNGEEEKNPYHAVIMLTATVIYLYLGFFQDLWHPGWIVFPAGTALCGLADVFYKRQ